MKRLRSFYLLAGLMMIGQTVLVAQPRVDTLKTHLNNFLDQWHRDAATFKHDAYIGAMTEDGVFIGTDATEHWTTGEFRTWSKPFFDRKRTWNFKPLSRNIYFGKRSETAWFDELLDTQMGICRGSGVLQKVNGRWKIAQYVLSATIPNDIMTKVTGMKAAADSMLALKSIFDKSGMTGTILIFDPANGRSFGHNPDRWDSGYLPASTFKIANSLIGLETGIIDTGYIFKWNGEKRRLPQWEKDLSLREAFRVSCVPCYQEVARKIGLDRMNTFLKKTGYPGMDVHSDNIDRFWLEGNSRITPRQQVAFLQQLHDGNLPIGKPVMQAVKSIMINEATPEYTLSGKTGWAIRNGNNYGWFVGWIETKGNIYYIATLVEPENQEKTDDFTAARKVITMEVLKYLGIIGRKDHE
ncbi:MAG: class D beta-lactamase [Bacteroidales bacterium]